MANDNICVFCGQKPGTFQSTSIVCGGIWQPACKACEKELAGLDEAELCRRALVRGVAENPDRLRERIALIAEAENHRPKCSSCGSSLSFMDVQELDNSPFHDGLLSTTFDVLPACCESCGKYEFFNPAIVRKNKYLAHLIQKDTKE